MAKGFQTLPGFRDFIPEDCAVRNYLFDTWKRVARAHGFIEYETPLLEDTELYLKKSGGELSTQLFRFTDQGGRDVTLRPEVTASLARLATTHQRDYPKPLKWFEIGQCFRYEKPQKGRGREFYQFNADLIGDASPAADAELIALAIATMTALGFTAKDFIVRLSNREVWEKFAIANNLTPEQLPELLQIIDKFEKTNDEKLTELLQPLGLEIDTIKLAMSNNEFESESLTEITQDLTARGYGDFIKIDHQIVRGLAYYTGTVFEIFDTSGDLRAVAGGGRYDGLLGLINPKAPLPATGFAMGDMVIRHLIEQTPAANVQLTAWLQNQRRCDLFLITADEAQRPETLRLVTELRNAGINTDLALNATKFDKQFKAAQQSQARYALIIGQAPDSTIPELRLKNLTTKSEETLPPNTNLIPTIQQALNNPEANGPLLA